MTNRKRSKLAIVNPDDVVLSLRACVKVLHKSGILTQTEKASANRKIHNWKNHLKKQGSEELRVKNLFKKYGNSEFGPYLKFLRLRQEISLQELSKRVGIPHSPLWRWETSKHKPTSEARVRKLCEYFNDWKLLELAGKLGD